MRIGSINAGQARCLKREGKARMTGIYKEPVDGPGYVSAEGLAGDEVLDKKHHGGPDQAIYIYGMEDYDWWAGELGETPGPGTFGENITVEGLASADLAVGDRLHAGEAILEVTAARIPCGTLAARMGDGRFVKRFKEAERAGAYCRVIREGRIRAGDEVTVEPYAGERITLLEVFRDFYEMSPDETHIRRYLAAPIASRLRRVQEERLAELLRAPGGS